MPTFAALKRHLISLYRPVTKSTFDVHNSQLRYPFQIRLGLSHLREHKHRHKFADTPSNKCICKNGVEDTHHFLIRYSFYKAKGMFYLQKLKLFVKERSCQSEAC